MAKIKHSVSKMANDITPAPPKTNKSLSHFAKLMSGFLGNKRGPVSPPIGGGERIELQFPAGRPTLEVVNEAEIRVRSRFTVRVADDAEKDRCRVRVTCALSIYEDDIQSQSKWPIDIELADSKGEFLREDDGSWVGVIEKANRITFDATSDAYPNLWTTSLQPAVTRIGDWE